METMIYNSAKYRNDRVILERRK